MNDQSPESPQQHSGELSPASDMLPAKEVTELDRAVAELPPDLVERIENRIADTGEPNVDIFKAAVLGCEGDRSLADLLVEFNRATADFNKPNMDSRLVGSRITYLTNSIVARRYELNQIKQPDVAPQDLQIVREETKMRHPSNRSE